MKKKIIDLKIRKNNDCLVTFGDGDKLSLNLDIVLKYKLSKDTCIDNLDNIIYDDNLIKAKSKVYYYATYKPRTEFEIINKLKSLNYDAFTIKECLLFLNSFNLINDSQFANDYIKYHLKQGKYSINLIKRKLQVKGIDKSILDNIYLNEPINFDWIINKTKSKIDKLKSKEKTNYQIHSSINLFLSQKGFSIDEIKHIKSHLDI